MSAPVDAKRETDAVLEEIRVMLARRRWKQSDLARHLQVSEVWVSRRLSGKTDISVGELYRIARVLEVTVFDLLPRSPLSREVTGRSLSSRPPRGAADLRPAGHPPVKRSVRLSEPMAA